ncbi:CASP-like protein 4B1 [Sesamum indicum]|uniref:CASP-like protein n=1 Tax=Sesamum indicum TaxID=4182 RepID=A0A6I9TA57_SESIN|nr:CASP-like protein 4B1 [Sesamum indicum]XP_011077506.1 CASP-like protein 4B1 [Sesamum indicum]
MDDPIPKPDQLVTPSPPLPPSRDFENQTGPQNSAPSAGGVVSNILRRWKREDFLKKASLALRTLAFLFSFLAFIIMASNKHGDWKDFNKYEEYRYVLAIAILSTLYTGFQVLRQLHELHTVREILPRRNLAIIDFSGDQIAAYLLISAASSAVPLTNRMREGADNIFTDSSAAAISMEFFAFFSLGLSAIVSGHKLSKQTYI